MNRNLAVLLATGAFTASAIAGGTTIYQESFTSAGAAPVLLHGTTEDVSSTVWSANSFVNDNGTINGANEGSALLPFQPVVNRVYTLQMDVSNQTDRWVALGFARDALIAPGASDLNDRLSNETEGISWMLYRKHASDVTQDVQIFGGLRTGNAITDNNQVNNFTQANTLAIILDTYGDGTTIKSDFLINGASILPSGPVTITRNIDDINFVGFAFDNATTAPVSVDNFLLTVIPEPTSLGALGLLALAGRRRHA